MMRLVAVFSAVALCASGTMGCYNTYVVTQDEFKKLQVKPESKDNVTVKDGKGRDVVVTEGTRLFVRSQRGRRYQVSAFNFKLTNSQLVASDRDTLLMTEGIKAYEVDHLSTWKTVGLVSLGAAALAGVIVAIIVTSGQKTFD